MKAWKRIVCSSMLATSIVAVPNMATADNGDNTPSCVANEICLSKDAGTPWQKHFWWGAEHGGYYWVNVTTGVGGTTVVNSASVVKNRDSACSIKIIDDRGILPDNYQVFAAAINTWYPLNSALNNQNDRHERC